MTYSGQAACAIYAWRLSRASDLRATAVAARTAAVVAAILDKTPPPRGALSLPAHTPWVDAPLLVLPSPPRTPPPRTRLSRPPPSQTPFPAPHQRCIYPSGPTRPPARPPAQPAQPPARPHCCHHVRLALRAWPQRAWPCRKQACRGRRSPRPCRGAEPRGGCPHAQPVSPWWACELSGRQRRGCGYVWAAAALAGAARGKSVARYALAGARCWWWWW